MLLDAVRYPAIFRAYLRAFKNLLKEKNRRGLKTTWKTPAEVMEWWIYGKENNSAVDPDQTIIFE